MFLFVCLLGFTCYRNNNNNKGLKVASALFLSTHFVFISKNNTPYTLDFHLVLGTCRQAYTLDTSSIVRHHSLHSLAPPHPPPLKTTMDYTIWLFIVNKNELSPLITCFRINQWLFQKTMVTRNLFMYPHIIRDIFYCCCYWLTWYHLFFIHSPF